MLLVYVERAQGRAQGSVDGREPQQFPGDFLQILERAADAAQEGTEQEQEAGSFTGFEANGPGAEVQLPADPDNLLSERRLVPAHGDPQDQEQQYEHGGPNGGGAKRKHAEEVIHVDEQSVPDIKQAVA
jgi:hypothetical protein